MNSFTLKLIAIITMLIDHTGAVFFPEVAIFRIVGRIAFPIFVFLLVEGLHYTKNIKKYLTRLGLFALISEMAFDLAFYQSYYGLDVVADLQNGLSNSSVMKEVISRFMHHQNIFFTLFLGLFAIYLMQIVEEKYKKEYVLTNILDALITIIFCAFALLLKTDYSMVGILFIIAFYLFRGNKALLGLSMILIPGILFGNTIQIFGILALIPIAFYNGKKGKDMKYFFYIFYPAHLLLLFVLSLIL